MYKMTSCEADCEATCNGSVGGPMYRPQEMSVASATGMFAVWAGFVCLFSVFGFLFFWGRKIRFIKSRSPEMVLLSALGGVWIVTNYTMSNFVTGIELWPCPYSNWTLWLGFTFYLFPFPIRALRLYLVFKRNVDKVKNHDIMQEKTLQRVTVVEQRLSRAPTNGNVDQSLQMVIARHKEKKAREKQAKAHAKTLKIKENDEEGLDAASSAKLGSTLSAELESHLPLEKRNSNVKKTTSMMITQSNTTSRLCKWLSCDETRTIRVESGLAEKGINTQINRGILERHLNHLFAALIVIFFIIAIIRQFIPSLGLGAPCTGCVVSLSSAIVETIIAFIVLTIHVVTTAFIRSNQVKDQFRIEIELQMITLVLFLFLVPACILAIIGSDCNVQSMDPPYCSTFDNFTDFCYYNFAAQHWLIILCCVSTFIITVFAPVIALFVKGRRRIKREPLKLKWPHYSALNSLADCLADDEGSDAFQRFCVQSFCVENILFWRDIEQYRKVSDLNELHVRAIAIYKRYIDSSGNLFVQLPEDIQQTLEEILGDAAAMEEDNPTFDYNFQVDKDVFESAQSEVFHYMETEIFPQFLVSEIAKPLREKHNHATAQMKTLQEQKLI
jgi:hypothetical protein